MRITPMDIHHKQFKTALRGYSEDEVDAFLDQVADQMDQLLQENGDLKNQIQDNQGKLGEYEKIEKTLQNALVNAQKVSEEVIKRAKDDAEALTEKNRKEINKEKSDTDASIKEALSNSAKEREEILASIERLKNMQEDYQNKTKEVMEHFLKKVLEVPPIVKDEDLKEEHELTEKISKRLTEFEEQPETAVEAGEEEKAGQPEESTIEGKLSEEQVSEIFQEKEVVLEEEQEEVSPFFTADREVDGKNPLDLFAEKEDEMGGMNLGEGVPGVRRRFRQKNKGRTKASESNNIDEID